jgi:hypothetical protein
MPCGIPSQVHESSCLHRVVSCVVAVGRTTEEGGHTMPCGVPRAVLARMIIELDDGEFFKYKTSLAELRNACVRRCDVRRRATTACIVHDGLCAAPLTSTLWRVAHATRSCTAALLPQRTTHPALTPRCNAVHHLAAPTVGLGVGLGKAGEGEGQEGGVYFCRKGCPSQPVCPRSEYEMTRM